MKYIKHTLIIAVIACMAYCKTSKNTTTAANSTTVKAYSPSETQLAAAQKRWQNATSQELVEGEKIFNNECTMCHQAFPIPGFSEKKWLHEIDDMSPKARLNAEQKEKLTRYILSAKDISPADGK